MNKSPAYNLSVVLRETGIKADTLRAWERRYGLPEPARTDGGHRLYSERDIATIRWLMARQNEGVRIKQAVNLWKELDAAGQDPLFARPIGSPPAPTPTTHNIDQAAIENFANAWVEACLQFDEERAEQAASQAFGIYPVETVVFQVLLYGLAIIGQRWYENTASVQQEHFASALVTRRLDALIAAAPPPTRPGTILVGCPATEMHTIAPLTLTLMLRQRGWRVVYLGANVPLNRLEETILSLQPNMIILIAQHLTSAAALLEIAEALARKEIRVAFGGLIFNRNPHLQASISGHFLGDQLKNAAESVEDILRSGKPIPAGNVNTEKNQKTLEHYKEKRPLIEHKIFRQHADEPFLFEHIARANQFLAENIESALRLGSLKWIDPELAWVESLIANNNMKPTYLKEYLYNYCKIAAEEMNEFGKPIIEWLCRLDDGLHVEEH